VDESHDVEVSEAFVRGSAFEVDTVIARLEADGVNVVRSSPESPGLRLGDMNKNGEHRLVFRKSDGVAIAKAMHEAGIV
jgi:hypothetical protein